MMFMPSCKEVQENLTEFMEGALPFRKRLGIRIHLMMCRMCDSVRKALAALPGFGKEALAPPQDTPSAANAVLDRVLESLNQRDSR